MRRRSQRFRGLRLQVAASNEHTHTLEFVVLLEHRQFIYLSPCFLRTMEVAEFSYLWGVHSFRYIER
jgi:hypothetical protein